MQLEPRKVVDQLRSKVTLHTMHYASLHPKPMIVSGMLTTTCVYATPSLDGTYNIVWSCYAKPDVVSCRS